MIEETEPLVETELRAAGLAVHGRSLLPPFAEVTAEHVARGARKLLGENEGASQRGRSAAGFHAAADPVRGLRLPRRLLLAIAHAQCHRLRRHRLLHAGRQPAVELD